MIIGSGAHPSTLHPSSYSRSVILPACCLIYTTRVSFSAAHLRVNIKAKHPN